VQSAGEVKQLAGRGRGDIRRITMLQFLDYFFLIFHAVFTIFNMTGWIWKKTRKVHLATIAATAFSWFIIGIWYGWGFCFCTDWHWRVREALGRPIRSYSYIHFLILETTGMDLPPAMVDNATMAIFIACCCMSILLNTRDYLRHRVRKGA